MKQVVNTTSDELSNVAVEVSVWDLEGMCPYYKVTENLSLPPKKTLPIIEMKYPKSKSPKPVYFLLLKLFNMSDYGILSRNFYWLHLPGGDYKLLETYRTKKIPIKIISKVLIKGSTYEIQMNLQNMSKNPNYKSLRYKNNIIDRKDENNYDMDSMKLIEGLTEEKPEVGLVRRIYKYFSREDDSLRIMETNGTDSGVAFFLHFSVHTTSKDKTGEDTRILPVHYTDNYFSLVPGETMTISISFEVPSGMTPRVTLHGWNYHFGHSVY